MALAQICTLVFMHNINSVHVVVHTCWSTTQVVRHFNGQWHSMEGNVGHHVPILYVFYVTLLKHWNSTTICVLCHDTIDFFHNVNIGEQREQNDFNILFAHCWHLYLNLGFAVDGVELNTHCRKYVQHCVIWCIECAIILRNNFHGGILCLSCDFPLFVLLSYLVGANF